MELDDAHISVRFKHGVHTIFLFVDALAPLSKLSNELLEVLKERYPSGLSLSTAPDSPKTFIPDDPRVVYAMLAVPNDPSKGWKRLKVPDQEATNATKAGMKQNSVVAFALLGEEDEDDEALFEVEWPTEESEMYE